MNWHSVLFAFFALVACGYAAAVVYTANVVRMALYLVCCLSATSGLFFLAGADFVGAMQLMIYVGGTLVLLIFGVMLTAQHRFILMKPGWAETTLASLLGLALLVLLTTAAFSVPAWRGTDAPAVALDQPPQTVTPLALALVGLRTDASPGGGEPLSGYLLPFEIVSVHLLVVLVGAAYLARTRILADSLTAHPPEGYDESDAHELEADDAR